VKARHLPPKLNAEIVVVLFVDFLVSWNRPKGYAFIPLVAYAERFLEALPARDDDGTLVGYTGNGC